MPYFTYTTAPDGLAVQVLVGLRRSRIQAIRQAGRAVPAPVQLRAIFDTGTDLTSAADLYLASLGLTPEGSMYVNTPAGPSIVNRYLVDLTVLPPPGGPAAGLVFRDLLILGRAGAPVGFEVLIGRDVLTDCLFQVDGKARTFTLAF